MLTSGLLTYLLCVLVALVTSRFEATSSASMANMAGAFVIGMFSAAIVNLIVAGMIIGNHGWKEWYAMYRACNVVGYDAFYHLLKDGTINCEVGARNLPWPRSIDDSFSRLYAPWMVMFPLNKRRPGRISGCVPAVTFERWQVTVTAQMLDEPPNFSIPESLWVRLSDDSGAGLEMKLPHAMKVIGEYISKQQIQSVRGLSDTMLYDLALYERLMKMNSETQAKRDRRIGDMEGKLLNLKEENDVLARQKQELERRVGYLWEKLCNAHEAMRRAMLYLAHSSRIGNSRMGQKIRMNLADTLYYQTDEEKNPDARALYEEYRKPSRPPRVRTTTTTT